MRTDDVTLNLASAPATNADRIPVEDGKYTVVIDSGRIRIDRHGAPWIGNSEITAPKMLISMAYELESLRDRVAELEAQV